MGDYSNVFNYRLVSYTNSLGKPPSFCHNSLVLNEKFNFASVYGIREEDARAIQDSGTAAGFKGVVWSQRLWADFDSEEAGLRAQAYLKEEGYDHIVYTTGNRGCHLGIARDCRPSHTLPMQDKLWAKEHLPGCDLSLYWHLHLLRLPGTVHESTGLPKRVLYKHTGRVLTLPPYTPPENMPESSIAQSLDQSGKTTRRGCIFYIWAIASQLTYNGGSRHDQLVRLAKALQSDGKVSEAECRWVVEEVNRGFYEPKGPEELNSIVRWAYGR